MELPASRRVLANGLTVVHHQDDSAPLVAVYVYYHVGSSREAKGKTGFAHLFEHMLFQGSENVPDNGHFQLIQEAGGTLNGTTNQDRTNYFETLPKEYLDLALFLESDRMGHLLPAMTQAKLDNQRDVVMNERRQSYENRPYGLVYETLLEGLYPEEHPYSWPTIGSMADIEAATLEDVDAFFRRWYGPNNATLVIAGDVERDHAFERAEHWFGAIQRGPDVATPAPRAAGLTEGRRLLLEDRVQLPQLSLCWPTVEAWHPDEPALNLLADLLSANGSSILDAALMIDEELASAVTISHGTGERAGMLTVTLRPARDVTLTRLEERVDELVAGVVTGGVDGARLERLKNRMEGGVLRGLESVSSRAGLLGSYQCFRGEVDLLERSLARHRVVTPEDLVDVARRYLVDRPRLTLSTVPEGRRELAAADRAPSRLASPEAPDRSAPPAPTASTPLELPEVVGSGLAPGRFHGIEDHTLPVVHLSLSLPGGQALERPEESGLAALTVALLQEGTERLRSAEVPDALDGLGAAFGTSATLEDTRVRMSTLSRTLEESLAFVREVLEQPRFAREDCERLVRQQRLGIETRIDRPTELADDLIRSLVFGTEDPRGRAWRGSLKAIETVDADAVRAFWERLRDAGAPQLAVLGEARVDPVARGIGLSGVASDEDPVVPGESQTDAVAGAIYLIDKPGAQQSELRLACLGIARDDVRYDRVSAVNHVLGGSFSSRLNMNLREDKGWTYGARSSVGGRRARGAIQVATAVETGVTAPALAEILSELRKLEDGFHEEEARFAASSLARSLRRAYAGSGARLAYLANLAEYGFAPDYPNHRLAELEGLTAADLDQTAGELLIGVPWYVAIVGDAGSIRAELEGLDVGPVLDGGPRIELGHGGIHPA